MAIAYYKMSLEQLEQEGIKVSSLGRLLSKHLDSKDIDILCYFGNYGKATEVQISDFYYDKVLKERVPVHITFVGKQIVRHIEVYPKDLKQLTLPEIVQRAIKGQARLRNARCINFFKKKREFTDLRKSELVFDHLLRTDYQEFKKKYTSFSERELFHIIDKGTGHCLCYYMALHEAINLSIEEFLQDGIIQRIYSKYRDKDVASCQKIIENWDSIVDYVKKKLFHKGWKILEISDNDWKYNGYEWTYDVKKEYIHIAPYHIQMISANHQIREYSTLINRNIYLVRKEE